MVEQIGTAIIMFLLGSVLTYFSTRWSRTLHKIESLEHGVQALLRDRMLQMYSYYKENDTNHKPSISIIANTYIRK